MPDDLENDGDTSDSSVIKDLRKQAAEAAELRAQLEAANAQNATLARNEAFRMAGLDPTNRLHAQVIKAYDGELDPTAAKAYVDELGLTTQSAPPPPQIPTQEMQQWQQAAASPAGGESTPPPQVLEDRYAEVFKSLPELNRNEVFGRWLESQGQEVSDTGVIPGSGAMWPGLNSDWNSDRGQVPPRNPVPPP